MIIEINNAEYTEDYRIELSFSNGQKKSVDFEPFLKKAKNPMTRKYLDLVKFKSFQLEYGDLKWGDYEMCFPIWDLYRGNIERLKD